MVGKEVQHPHITKSSLMEAVVRAMKDMNKDHLVKACSRIRTRTEWIIGAVLTAKFHFLFF